MWLSVSRQWLGVRRGRAALPRSARRPANRESFRPTLERLESRWCPALTLTQAGRDAGIVLSVFAVDFPNSVNNGPLGVAFPGTGGVLVSDYPGNVRLFPTDADGQSAAWVPPARNYGVGNADDLAQLGDNLYMSQFTSGQIVQIHPDGTLDHVIATGLPHALGMRADPATGRLFVAVQANNQVIDLDPNNPGDRRTFARVTAPDGLTLSADGRTLYVAQTTPGSILGFDTATGQQVFDSGPISGTPDGVAEGVGPLAGKLFINTNGNGTNTGTVVEVDIADPSQKTVIASGGSRGDFVRVDPRDGSVLVTQTDRIVRLTFPFGAAQRLTVGGFPSPSTAGTPGDLTVTALDQDGMLATGYTGTVHFTSSDGQANLPADYTFTAADRGQHTFTNGVTLTTAGSQALTVTDTADPRLTATQSGIVVSPAAASTLLVTDYPSATVAGQVNGFTVTAQDPYGNTATDYRGTVHFTSSDPQALLGGDYTFGPADRGSHPFGAILKTAGTQALTATDTSDASITGTQDGIVVTPAPAVSFTLSAPAGVSSGSPFDVTVTALDPYGNTDTNYQGTVTFSTSDPDPGVALPADYTFQPSDAGQATFPGGVTLITPGDQTLTVTDTADNTITGSVTITVGSAAPGMGSHGPGSQPEPSRLEGSAPQASEPPPRQVVAVDGWFASRNERDVGFILALPTRHARAGADSRALDPWWGDEPLFT